MDVKEMIESLKEIFNSTDKVALLISSISVFIAAISTIVAIVANHRNRVQYKTSIQPQLSMKLVDYDYRLFLQIKNTGKTHAKNIEIIPKEMKNNGNDQINKSGLFETKFELYPEEMVQTEIAYLQSSLCYQAFPQITIEISYYAGKCRKKCHFTRTITYAPAYENKISADINLDTKKIEDTLKCISRAVVRTANYLDGCQVASFDELDLTPGKTLENDLHKTLGQRETPVMTRTETIKKALKKMGNRKRWPIIRSEKKSDQLP